MNRRGFFGALAGGIAAATGARAARGGLADFGPVACGRTDTALARHGLLPHGYKFTSWRDLAARLDLPVADRTFSFKPDFSVRRAQVGLFENARETCAGDAVECIEGEASGVSVVDVIGVGDGLSELRLDASHDVHQAIDQVGLVLRPTEDQGCHQGLQPCDATQDAELEVPVVGHSTSPPLSLAVGSNIGLHSRPDHSGFITATAVLPPVVQMKRLLDRFGTSGEASPAFVEALIGELVLTRVRLAAADPRVLCAFDRVAA